MGIERRQKEIEDLKLKEVENRKKNIESLMNKRAEREKKQIRTRVLKQESKRNALGLEESKEGTKRLKVEETRSNKSPEVNSADLKRKTIEPASATELHTHKEIDTANEGVDGEKSKELCLRSDSHRQSLQNVNAQYFMSPTGLPETESPKEGKTVNYMTSSTLKAETKFKQVLSESIAITKGRGRERMTDSFKLPTIKTGRVIIGPKVSQSPYLKDSEELNTLKTKGKKDNKENVKEKI